MVGVGGQHAGDGMLGLGRGVMVISQGIPTDTWAATATFEVRFAATYGM